MRCHHALLGCLVVLGSAGSARANYIDSAGFHLTESGAQMIRGRIGGGLLGLSNIAGAPNRSAGALQLHVDTGLSTKLTDGSPGLTFYDAAFADLGLGWLTSEPLSFLGEKEGRMTYDLKAGYLFMVGWRLAGNGVFVGVQPSLCQRLQGGSSVNLQTSTPLAFRVDLDLGGDRHFLATTWIGHSEAFGALVELVLTHGYGLYASYSQLHHDEADVANQLNTLSSGATATALTAGFRTGHWR